MAVGRRRRHVAAEVSLLSPTSTAAFLFLGVTFYGRFRFLFAKIGFGVMCVITVMNTTYSIVSTRSARGIDLPAATLSGDWKAMPWHVTDCERVTIPY